MAGRVIVDDEQPAESVLTVVIADPDPLAARMVRDALQARSGLQVAAVANDGREAVEITLHYRPAVTVLEIELPGDDGIETIRRIAAGAPEVGIVVFSWSERDDRQLDAIGAGAVGFLHKSAGVDRLPNVIRAVAQGEAAVSREITKRLIERFRALPEDGIGMRPVWSDLTTREWQVLDLISQGKSTRVMAAELFLSEETVYGHAKSLMRKLGVNSREEATRVAKQLRGPLSGQDPAS